MSTFDSQNVRFAQAVSFVNHTNRPIFLTGKAGTGKTTFLRYIREHTYKKLAVVAPTGVAAINAGGSTIHSLFFLPFGLYIADYELHWNDQDHYIYNKQRLFSKVKLTKQRRTLLQELDLLIIDEVSMLRADTLDAIDTILRWARRNAAPFGGVQMLFIGDLYQLPPVVKTNEQALLFQHYRSPFFFDAHVMQEAQPVLLELNKIYRQNDPEFISLLNAIRNNECHNDQLEKLNAYYRPAFEPQKEDAYITLTSHNRLADEINQQQLAALPGKTYTFNASISGDFSESAFPTESKLVLKEGAQIMFIKNDKGEERRYYNGKIGVVEEINNGGAEIKVRFPGEQESFVVDQEEWRNLRYAYNREEDRINEETLGTFKQYPIRLAWAVTIHKSQGLTFERAVIDAGASFAAGQVYVALSRLTSLTGLVLRSKITLSSIYTDPYVLAFSKGILNEEQTHELLLQEQKAYLFNNLSNTFLWNNLTLETNSLKGDLMHKNIADKSLAFKVVSQIAVSCNAELEVADKFRNWLGRQANQTETVDVAHIHERTQKAAAWFIQDMNEQLINPLKNHIAAWKIKKRTKGYLKDLQDLLLIYLRKQQQIQQSTQVTQAILEGKNIASILEELSTRRPDPVVTGSAKSDKKASRGDSKRITLELFKTGKSVSAIAEERSLTPGTVISHLTSFVGSAIDATELMQADKLENIVQLLKAHPDKTATEIRRLLNEQVEFHEIRIAQATLRAEEATAAKVD